MLAQTANAVFWLIDIGIPSGVVVQMFFERVWSRLVNSAQYWGTVLGIVDLATEAVLVVLVVLMELVVLEVAGVDFIYAR